MNQARFDPQAKYPSEEAITVFADAKMVAVKSTDRLIYASLPHLCEALGLGVENQVALINEHADLAEGICSFNLHNGNVHIFGRGLVTTPCLRTNLIPLWLTLVSQEKHERQARILLFQSKAADALDNLFSPDVPIPALTNADLVTDAEFNKPPPEAKMLEELRERVMREL